MLGLGARASSSHQDGASPPRVGDASHFFVSISRRAGLVTIRPGAATRSKERVHLLSFHARAKDRKGQRGRR